MTLEEFYSNEPTKIWQKIIYNNHYHFGYKGSGNMFENTVRNVYPFIKGKDILDCGCGWGGTSQMLCKELNANVTSITISRKQYEYAKAFLNDCILKDINDFIPYKKYDIAIFIESFLHLTSPEFVLKNFSENIKSIYINEMYSLEDIFYCNEWRGYFRNKEEYIKIFNNSDFKIEVLEDCSNDVMKNESLSYWSEKLSNLSIEEKKGQLLTLEKMTLQELKTPSKKTSFIKLFATKR